MKKIVLILGFVLLVSTAVHATPSTTYWTPMTMDIQGYKVLHLGIDNYFTTGKRSATGEQGAFPHGHRFDDGRASV